MPAPTPIIKGLSTISWGTSSLLGSPSGVIVEGGSITPKNASPVADIEDGNGASASLVLLKDGFSAKINVLYDSAKTWPAEGDTVALTLAKTGAAGGTESFNCVLISYGHNPSRKKELVLEMNLEYRPGITLT